MAFVFYSVGSIYINCPRCRFSLNPIHGRNIIVDFGLSQNSAGWSEGMVADMGKKMRQKY